MAEKVFGHLVSLECLQWLLISWGKKCHLLNVLPSMLSVKVLGQLVYCGVWTGSLPSDLLIGSLDTKNVDYSSG